MQTRNLTIMFTDMKGFTARTSVGSRRQVEHLLDMHDHVVRPVFGQFGGTVVKTIGDAFLVTFESPTDAVLCGMRLQEVVTNHNLTSSPDERFEVRVAVNAGEVHLKDGDIFGEPVNVAARIVGIAEPSEVYFTEAVYLTMNKNEIPSSEVGSRHLKGIPEQVRVYKVLQERTHLLRSQQARREAAEKAANLPKGGTVEPAAAATARTSGGPGDVTVAASSSARMQAPRHWPWILLGVALAVAASIGIGFLVRSQQEFRSKAKPAIEQRIINGLKK